jgi:hypothetical protein
MAVPRRYLSLMNRSVEVRWGGDDVPDFEDLFVRVLPHCALLVQVTGLRHRLDGHLHEHVPDCISKLTAYLLPQQPAQFVHGDACQHLKEDFIRHHGVTCLLQLPPLTALSPPFDRA